MKVNQTAKLILVLYASACVNKAPATTDGRIASRDTIAGAPIKATDTAVATPINGSERTLAATIKAADTLPAGKLIDTVFCQSDPSQSYALYIPVKSGSNPMPVIYFFDPHAAGALPLLKYRSLADTYGFILVGSNNSKNGNDWSAADNIWSHLSEDTRRRLPINNSRIYTDGFSGGAKVASYIALNHPEIKGVIAGGAGLPDGTAAGDFPFSFTAIAGEGDMNMTELIAVTTDLDKTRTPHRLILFDGKHEWATEAAMDNAFAGLQFDAMRTGAIPKDEVFISRYTNKSKERVGSFEKSSQLIKAFDECGLAIEFLDGLTGQAAWFKAKAAAFENSPVYRNQRKAQADLLAKEETIKAGYMDHFQQAGMGYWNQTIVDLQAKARTKTSEHPMYQRLLAYLSLAFYSFSNRSLTAGQYEAAAHFVTLYKMADPTNSEAWYFSAILHARSGQAAATQDDLLKAADHGFKDKERMLQQPEFKSLTGQLDFARIESRMKTVR